MGRKPGFGQGLSEAGGTSGRKSEAVKAGGAEPPFNVPGRFSAWLAPYPKTALDERKLFWVEDVFLIRG
jgi:hypothetical protein